MKIKEIQINGFGKLENKQLDFSEGINLIVGKNEAGKSTLLKFITSMFYGVSKTKNGKPITDYERYKPWGKEEYSGKLTYELDNGEEFEIYREFKKKSPILYDKDKNDVTKNYGVDTSKGSQFFAEQTGVKEENFFASSAVEQEGVQLTDKARTNVIQKLSNIVLSGNENTTYNIAIDRISRKQMEEIGTSRSSGRPINIIESKIKKLEQEKQEREKHQGSKYQIDDQKERIREEIEENQEILNILRAQKINIEKAQIEEEKIKIFEEKVIKEKEEIDKLERETQEKKEEKIETQKTSQKEYIVIAILAIAITAIAIITTIWQIIIANIIPIIIAIIAKTKQKNQQTSKQQKIRKQIQEKQMLEKQLNETKEEHEKSKSELQHKKEEIEKQNKEKQNKIIEEYKNKIPEETIKDILSTKYEKIVEYIGEKEREQTEKRVKEKTIDIENKNILKKVEELVEIDEKLEELYEKKNELIELNDMYETVKTEIDKAYKEMKEKITPTFVEDLKEILKTVTKGKYTNVYINNENAILIETRKWNISRSG